MIWFHPAVVYSVIFLMSGLLFCGLLTWVSRWRQTSNIDRSRANARLFREQQSELAQQRDEGRIDENTYQQLLADLKKNLLVDVDGKAEILDEETEAGKVSWALRLKLSLAAATLVTATLGWLLSQQGTLDWYQAYYRASPFVDAWLAGQELPQGYEAISTADFVRTAQYKLSHERDNLAGWMRLAELYYNIEMKEAAVEALQVIWHHQEDPIVGYQLAQMMIADNQGAATPESTRILEKIISRQPDNENALAALGLSSVKAGDFNTAMSAWNRLRALLEARGEDTALIEKSIAATRQRQAEMEARQQVVVESGIRVSVTLDETLRQNWPESARLFIVAKAVSGPPMPLAARKLPVDLPVEVVLTKQDAVVEGLSIEGHAQVQVSAHISIAGQAVKQSGDIYSDPVTVDMMGEKAVSLILDKRL